MIWWWGFLVEQAPNPNPRSCCPFCQFYRDPDTRPSLCYRSSLRNWNAPRLSKDGSKHTHLAFSGKSLSGNLIAPPFAFPSRISCFLDLGRNIFVFEADFTDPLYFSIWARNDGWWKDKIWMMKCWKRNPCTLTPSCWVRDFTLPCPFIFKLKAGRKGKGSWLGGGVCYIYADLKSVSIILFDSFLCRLFFKVTPFQMGKSNKVCPAVVINGVVYLARPYSSPGQGTW